MERLVDIFVWQIQLSIGRSKLNFPQCLLESPVQPKTRLHNVAIIHVGVVLGVQRRRVLFCEQTLDRKFTKFNDGSATK